MWTNVDIVVGEFDLDTLMAWLLLVEGTVALNDNGEHFRPSQPGFLLPDIYFSRLPLPPVAESNDTTKKNKGKKRKAGSPDLSTTDGFADLPSMYLPPHWYYPDNLRFREKLENGKCVVENTENHTDPLFKRKFIMTTEYGEAYERFVIAIETFQKHYIWCWNCLYRWRFIITGRAADNRSNPWNIEGNESLSIALEAIAWGLVEEELPFKQRGDSWRIDNAGRSAIAAASAKLMNIGLSDISSVIEIVDPGSSAAVGRSGSAEAEVHNEDGASVKPTSRSASVNNDAARDLAHEGVDVNAPRDDVKEVDAAVDDKAALAHKDDGVDQRCSSADSPNCADFVLKLLQEESGKQTEGEGSEGSVQPTQEGEEIRDGLYTPLQVRGLGSSDSFGDGGGDINHHVQVNPSPVARGPQEPILQQAPQQSQLRIGGLISPLRDSNFQCFEERSIFYHQDALSQQQGTMIAAQSNQQPYDSLNQERVYHPSYTSTTEGQQQYALLPSRALTDLEDQSLGARSFQLQMRPLQQQQQHLRVQQQQHMIVQQQQQQFNSQYIPPSPRATMSFRSEFHPVQQQHQQHQQGQMRPMSIFESAKVYELSSALGEHLGGGHPS